MKKNKCQTIIKFKAKIVFDPIDKTKKHKDQSSWKNVAICKTYDDIDLYYSWFIFKRFNLTLNRSIRGSHVTIINDKIIDKEKYDKVKKLYNGKEIEFSFNPSEIRSNGEHWWLKVYSDTSKEIRKLIGLTEDPFFPLHLTLGYSNEKNKAHSEYILRQILKYNL